MLDPFVGIGHSALAAKECGVKSFIGFDIDPVYVETARSVLEKDGMAEPARPKKARKKSKDQAGMLFGMTD
jgi:ribosomal protein L11 methylase PrmA